MDGWCVAACAEFVALCMCVCMASAWKHLRDGAVGRMAMLNPHAHLLGRVVEARPHRRSDWVRCRVVAVSWKGAVCVRQMGRDVPGRWIHKSLAPDRVRLIESGDGECSS